MYNVICNFLRRARVSVYVCVFFIYLSLSRASLTTAQHLATQYYTLMGGFSRSY